MHKTLLIFFVLLWHFNAIAQVKPLVCDTCQKTKFKERNNDIDSNIKSSKEKVNSQKDSLYKLNRNKVKTDAENVRDRVNSKTDSAVKASYRKNINKKTDSSARNSIKKSAFESGSKVVNKTKAMPLNKWNQLKSKLPERKQILRFTGEVRSESYYSNLQNPVMRNEPMYCRLYITPTISLFGLPFKANFFFTTESNNTWKNNFFSIRFDANAMRQKAMEDMQKQMDEAKKLDRLRQVDLQKNALESGRYEKELDKYKKQVPDLDNIKDELRKKAEENSKSFIDNEKAELEEKLKEASEEEKLKLEQEFNKRKDSVINHYKQKAGDSILSAKGNLNSKADTAKLGKYLRMQQKLDALKSKKQELENLRQMDSAQLLKKVSGMRNPDDIRKMAKDQMPDKKLLNAILAVDRFGIGLVNPQYSEFTLFAASIKGLDIGVNKEKYFYDLSLGKTTRQFTSPFSDLKPEFDRNLGIFRLGYGQLKGNYIGLEYLYAFDQASDNSNLPLIKNGVINISGRFTLLRNTVVEANAAQSQYKEQYLEQRSNYNAADKSLNGSANKAYQIKATQTVGENSKVEASLRQTGAAFRTVGNPFLRRNFREVEIKYEQQFFKKKVKFSGFYKEMRDNLIELNTSTNRLKGYGLKLSTSFEKYPNVSVSYSPYQQGNNHPDSLYKTNNQFSITNIMISYKRRLKSLSWIGLVNYTRSAMEINERGIVAYKMLSTIHTLQIGQRHTSILSYMNNVTAPYVDSLNSNSIQFNHNYLAKKDLSFGVIGENTFYKNGAYKKGGGMIVTTKLLKNFTISLLARYDRINKLWQMDNADVFTGKVVMVWRW